MSKKNFKIEMCLIYVFPENFCMFPKLLWTDETKVLVFGRCVYYLKKLIHALIFTRIDYCNSVFKGLLKKSIRQLQLIQNAADLKLKLSYLLVFLLYYLV
ncbi:hypothetical protein XENOCAPTIV_016432 [Xenoophorus captivus]|uniref:Uncharacterized protein n=1 Tax=Xenoophorus captivus TaxID=1517983 RepID=A0ABV0QJQ1_9TELE